MRLANQRYTPTMAELPEEGRAETLPETLAIWESGS